jgi:hypothetical protein
MDEVSMLNSIIVKKTPTDQFVPVKNGIFLHSAYDPIKEAANFLEKHQHSIAEKKDILILGLGFGYHVDAILEYCKSLTIAPTVTILEPDLQLISLAIETRKENYNNIFSQANIEDLFNNSDFIRLLMKKPYLIPHGPSISSNEKYFKEFLTHHANKNLSAAADKVVNQEAAELLRKVSTFAQLESQLLQKQNLTSADFLLRSFMNIESQGKNL